MPYANNNGVRIYYEVEGEGPSAVLAHGLSGSTNMWRRNGGYVNALRGDFRLILFDARGHGQSQKPHDASSYGLKMADDVVAVLDDLRISDAHYLGYSMGARLGFRTALRHADRFRSFVLGGCSPYRDEAQVKVEEELMEGMKMLLADREAFLRRAEQLFRRPLTPDERSAMLANDAEALIDVVTSFQEMPVLSDHDLSLISVPCLVYCGDADPRYSGAKRGASHLPQARFVSLPGLDHGQAGMRSDLVLPHIKEFLAGVSKI
jgi:pimeloyl-ACP methyl ester carboxylesterase